MTNKTPFETGVEIHQKIEESLREFGEAFITKDGEVIHPEKVKVETDENGKKVFCVGKSIDNEIFAVLGKKETLLADLLRPRPYMSGIMAALEDPEVGEISLFRRREPTFNIRDHVEPKTTALELAMKTTPLCSFKPNYLVQPIEVELAATDYMTETLDKVGKLLAEDHDRMILHTIAYHDTKPKSFKKERRIARYLMSSDRRRQKRGNRLFHQWRKDRPGYNLQNRYRKD